MPEKWANSIFQNLIVFGSCGSGLTSNRFNDRYLHIIPGGLCSLLSGYNKETVKSNEKRRREVNEQSVFKNRFYIITT